MRALLLAGGMFVAATLFASTDPNYTALRAARPDGRTIAVNNLTFDRDAYHVTLNGTLHLLEPVSGTTVGAVFLGTGSYELTPASDAERKLLAVNAGDSALTKLRDDFDSMVIFDRELMTQLSKTPAAKGAPSSDATRAYERFMDFQKKDLKENLHLRVLQSLLNTETMPLFLAVPAGKKFAKMLLIVDGMGHLDGEETALISADDQRRGIWYSSHLRGEKAHGAAHIAQAAHYDVFTFFEGNRDEISGTTTIDAMSATDNVRVVPIVLDPRLRIEDASWAVDAKSDQWKPLAFVQENEKEDGNSAVIFPAAQEQGASFFIRVKYRGREVLKSAGDGNFYVQARTSWYPNLGTFTEMASYDLTFRFPKAYEVVSVGDLVDDKTVGDQRTMTFKAADPIRVAGFNFGKFRKVSRNDKTTGLTVDVYTNPGTPDIIKEINSILASARQRQTVMTDYGTPIDVGGGPSEVYLDANGLVESAMADAMNASRVASTYFGAVPLKHLAITQQTQFDYGQSWPGLVYLPYLAVISGTVRAMLGGTPSDAAFIEQVGPHEVAHQWWGHNVGAATYHDEWLNEGFADFTAALTLQFSGGIKKYNDFWETARKTIVTKPPRAFISNQDAGPITEGWRLSTWQNRSAYWVLVYNKGAYVLHMLRMTMQDRSNKENPDAQFIAMMSDFVRSYGGRNATTEDFKTVVQRHMTRDLNATGDGKIDWFFNQWVYGSAIPRYTSKFDVTPGAEGKFHIKGSITQAEVPEDFRVLVPVYVEFDKAQVFKVAQIPMIGSTTRDLDFEVRLPKKPNKISLNALHDVLAK